MERARRSKPFSYTFKPRQSECVCVYNVGAHAHFPFFMPLPSIDEGEGPERKGKKVRKGPKSTLEVLRLSLSLSLTLFYGAKRACKKRSKVESVGFQLRDTESNNSTLWRETRW